MFGWLRQRSWRRVQGLLSEYLDGRLDARSEARVRDYVASHPEARAHLDELRSTVELLHRAPMAEPSRSFALPYAPAQAPFYEPPRRLAPLRLLQMATATTAVALAVLVTADITGGFGTNLPAAPVAQERQGLAAEQVAAQVETEVAVEAEAVTEDVERSVENAAAPPADEPFPTPGTEMERPDQETASTAAFAPPETAAPAGRQTYEWAILALTLTVALLALVTVGWTWRVARRRSG